MMSLRVTDFFRITGQSRRGLLLMISLCLLLSTICTSPVIRHWLEQAQQQHHELQGKKLELLRERQWLYANRSLIVPVTDQLTPGHDDALGMIDRAVAWLKSSAGLNPVLEWDDAPDLVLTGNLPGQSVAVSVQMAQRQLRINTRIENENILLKLINSFGEISSGATDLRRCEMERSADADSLELSCELVVVSLPSVPPGRLSAYESTTGSVFPATAATTAFLASGPLP